MAQGRSTPSLSEIEPLLREITDAYHLGVHLGVPAKKLKEFEREYRDVARQRTEAVSYWRHNCDNVTWYGLAEAVEKLGYHGNLVKKLRERAQESSFQDGARIEATTTQASGSSLTSGLGDAQESTNDRRYLANVLSKEVKGRHSPVVLDIFISVIWNTSAHHTAINDHVSFKDALLETNQPIEFVSDEVTFSVSALREDWRICEPLNSPVIRKIDVDAFTPGESLWVPHCHFRAKYQGAVHPVPDLECSVVVEGARKPHNKFTIDISPQYRDHPMQYSLPSPPTTSAYRLESSQHSSSIQERSPLHERLTSQHHATLLQQLQNHAARWRDIGRELGFTQGELDNIQANLVLAIHAPQSYLSELLSKWLEWAPGDRRGSKGFPTLEGLKDALLKANIGGTAYSLHL